MTHSLLSRELGFALAASLLSGALYVVNHTYHEVYLLSRGNLNLRHYVAPMVNNRQGSHRKAADSQATARLGDYARVQGGP